MTKALKSREEERTEKTGHVVPFRSAFPEKAPEAKPAVRKVEVA